MFRIEHNVETNEVIERDMTVAELKKFEAHAAAALAKAESAAKAELDKAALLERLGITADEAILLLS
jgi:hypothetical protein